MLLIGQAECAGLLVGQVVAVRATVPGELRHAGFRDFRKLRHRLRQDLPDLLVPAFQDLLGLGVDRNQDVDVLRLAVLLGIPDAIPAVEMVRPCVAEDVAARLHAHRELVGK